VFAAQRDLRFSFAGARGVCFGGPRSLRISQLMIAAQIAACFVVLTGAVLLVNSALHIQADSLGIASDGVAATWLTPANRRDAGRRTAFHAALLERLRSVPGVSSAAIASFLPPSREAGDALLEIRGNPPSQTYDVAECAASPAIFEVLRTPLLRGRMFDQRDRPDSPLVAIVSESLAREYFPGSDPLGHAIRVLSFSGTPPWLTIVGVAGDWRHLEWDARWVPTPLVFRPLAQDPFSDYAVAVRTERPVPGLARSISEAILGLDPSTPVEAVETLDSRIAGMRMYPRFRAFVVMFFASVALIIVAVGLHGTLTQIVSRRIPELGLRRAIGAQSSDLLWLVGRHGGIPVIAGLISGMIATPAAARILRSLFVGLTLLDLRAMVLAVVLLLVVAILTIALPARRATQVDPIAALRQE